jgi:uncharacterized protein YfaS (alpha-2-macroglobulin family)
MKQRTSLIRWTLIALASCLVLFTAFSKNTFPKKRPMPLKDYPKEWKAIDSLENQGLIRSALEKVELLLERAKNEKEAGQVLKSLIYRSKYQSQLEENGNFVAIQSLQKELENAPFPEKPVLQSMLGQLYANHFVNNSWQLRNRTTISDFRPDDPATWSAEELQKESNRLYLASLQDPQTRSFALKNLDAVIYPGVNVAGLRPNLFDLLAFRAIEHFSNSRSFVTAPINKFSLRQAEAFADAATFANFNFTAEDQSSQVYQALKIYQEVIKSHLADKDPAALLDADLLRLEFVNEHAVMGNKEDLYLQALQNFAQKHKTHPTAAMAIYRVAKVYQIRGQRYDPFIKSNEQYRLLLKKAKEIAETCIKEYPRTPGAQFCKTLLSELSQKFLNVQSEYVLAPQKPILVKLNFRNLNKAFFRIALLTPDQLEKYKKTDGDKQLDFLRKLKPLRKWSTALPDDGDLQEHSTEIKVDALPAGYYVILAAETDAMGNKETPPAYYFLQVSKLSFLSQSDVDGSTRLAILNRETGEPLSGVEAVFISNEWERENRRYRDREIGRAISDKNGFVKTEVAERSFKVKLIAGKDILYPEDQFYNYRRETGERTSQQTVFFLDRAIYRPGQTVYYKGIAFERDGKNTPRILANTPVIVTFFDANSQEVARKELRTNEYGSINGSFVAPQGGLRGQMSLMSSIGASYHSFRVEEYKRPTFEVTLKPLEGQAKLEQDIVIKGEAKAYAGSSISNAKVTYRVVREVRIPWWIIWRWNYAYNEEAQEIANGETQTDADGKFSIPFKAQADQNVDPKYKPEFGFTVYTDVVDVTGETHSSSSNVNIGYVGLRVDLEVAEFMDINKQMSLKLSATNLDGQKTPASGSIVIQSLKAPNGPLLERYWTAPDRPSMAEKDFKKDFPNLAFGKENEKENWATVAKVFEQNFNTAQSDSLNLPLSSLSPGYYRIEVKTQDSQGEKIEFTKFFQTYDGKNGKLAGAELFRAWMDQNEYEPGQKAKVIMASNAPLLKVLLQEEQDERVVSQRWIDLKNWQEEVREVIEADRGNSHFGLIGIWNSRYFSQDLTMNVPWNSKMLKIEYQTFRDKLLPGQDEEWRLRITGPKGEKVAAEMVAAMYDESLDAFAANSWGFWPYINNWGPRFQWQARGLGSTSGTYAWANSKDTMPQFEYPGLNWFGYIYDGFFDGQRPGRVSMRSRTANAMPEAAMMAPQADMTHDLNPDRAPVTYSAKSKKEEEVANVAPPSPPVPTKPATTQAPITPRKNLQETVFFMPELATDATGAVIVKFKMNEALTRWKFLGLTHTKDLQVATTSRSVVTQKDLMLQPAPPRFLREGDEIELTAKVSNLSDKTLSGSATLQLFDALNQQPQDQQLGNMAANVPFTVPAGQTAPLVWKLKIPVGGASAITYRMTASAGSFSDGEENVLPVLSNRMLVTETLPLFVRGKQERTFTLTSMAENRNSTTLVPHRLSLEFTSNPAWLAVKALPYLMEYPHECAEQIFSRYYANALAGAVVNQHPKVKAVFEKWKGTDALQSNLRANQELKAVLLEETPWVLEAQSEEKQRQQIAILFDLERMGREEKSALDKLRERQSPNGAWAWFSGGRESWYITQHIVAGLGHLEQLGVKSKGAVGEMSQKAVQFLDDEAAKYYQELQKMEKEKRGKLGDDHLSDLIIHYLYTRSFYPDVDPAPAASEALKYYRQQAQQYWTKKGNYQQSMLALALHRNKDADFPQRIVKSLRERALQSAELGMYWKNPSGYYWHEAPIETQALMIELFSEVAKDDKSVEEMKVWLLRNKQTTHWKTTKATAEAVYALLNTQGKIELLADAQAVDLSFGQLKNKEAQASIAKAQKDGEAGTGYFKTTWQGKDVQKGMEAITVKNPNAGIAWGGIYWQYFEQLDKIKSFVATPLTLRKQLFKQENSPNGPKLREISPNAPLKPGDKVIVRVELRSDSDMEYIHLKDMRAAGFEPMNVLSQYKWQGGLGYYESTGDAATNFFIDYLPKGTYVFEYPLRVMHKGSFSNGISSIQCMYAPEFSSFSSGERVEVK